MNLEDFKSNLQKLKRNLEKCPEEILKTKYKEAYDEIRNNLKKMAEEYLLEQCLPESLIMESTQAQAAAKKINQAIKESGLLKKVSRAVFKTQDFTEIENLAAQLKDLIQKEVEPFIESKEDKDDQPGE